MISNSALKSEGFNPKSGFNLHFSGLNPSIEDSGIGGMMCWSLQASFLVSENLSTRFLNSEKIWVLVSYKRVSYKKNVYVIQLSTLLLKEMLKTI